MYFNIIFIINILIKIRDYKEYISKIIFNIIYFFIII